MVANIKKNLCHHLTNHQKTIIITVTSQCYQILKISESHHDAMFYKSWIWIINVAIMFNNGDVTWTIFAIRSNIKVKITLSLSLNKRRNIFLGMTLLSKKVTLFEFQLQSKFILYYIIRLQLLISKPLWIACECTVNFYMWHHRNEYFKMFIWNM